MTRRRKISLINLVKASFSILYTIIFSLIFAWHILFFIFFIVFIYPLDTTLFWDQNLQMEILMDLHFLKPACEENDIFCGWSLHCKNFPKRYAWLSVTFLSFISFEQVTGNNKFRQWKVPDFRKLVDLSE